MGTPIDQWAFTRHCRAVPALKKKKKAHSWFRVDDLSVVSAESLAGESAA